MNLKEFIEETEKELQEKVKEQQLIHKDWCNYYQISMELYHGFFVDKFEELYRISSFFYSINPKDEIKKD